MMMVVVAGRAFIATVMPIIWSGCFLMIILAAMPGHESANIHPAGIGTEDAGIQPGQRANNHQPCENRFHQVAGGSMPIIANSRKNSLAEPGRRSCTLAIGR